MVSRWGRGRGKRHVKVKCRARGHRAHRHLSALPPAPGLRGATSAPLICFLEEGEIKLCRRSRGGGGSQGWGVGNFPSVSQETQRAPSTRGTGPFSKGPWRPGLVRGHRPRDPSPQSPFNSFSKENLKYANLIMSCLHSKTYQHSRPLVAFNTPHPPPRAGPHLPAPPLLSLRPPQLPPLSSPVRPASCPPPGLGPCGSLRQVHSAETLSPHLGCHHS